MGACGRPFSFRTRTRAAADDIHARVATRRGTTNDTTASPARDYAAGSRARSATTPHRSRLAGFIIDCNTGELDAAADFWSAALGMSIADRDAGDATAEYQQFKDTPAGLAIEVQKVEHAPRVHLDIEADDIDAEAARLEALGAKKVAFVKRWWVMEAPTGHRFCVIRMREDAGRGPAREWP